MVIFMLSLKDIKPNEKCIVTKIIKNGDIYRRFLDIGLIEGTVITCVTRSPSGDPKAFLIRGAVIAIRQQNCAGILVEKIG